MQVLQGGRDNVRLQALSKNYFSINSAKYGYIYAMVTSIRYPEKYHPYIQRGPDQTKKKKWHLPNTRLILL
jgi:hypothetical protein